MNKIQNGIKRKNLPFFSLRQGHAITLTAVVRL
jgi:hypothetical protein